MVVLGDCFSNAGAVGPGQDLMDLLGNLFEGPGCGPACRAGGALLLIAMAGERPRFWHGQPIRDGKGGASEREDPADRGDGEDCRAFQGIRGPS